MTYQSLAIALATLVLVPVRAQAPLYESRIADLGEIQLEYMDFGGEGLPLIWVQDFHNYFEGLYADPTGRPPFFAQLAEDARVLAPLRRGYGASTDTRWGYDVATQAEDLLQFMDALGIEKAVLYGRTAATQDMTWISEHHPERIAGLIYVGNPLLIAECSEPAVIAFVENNAGMARDLDAEQERRVVMSRALWRPRFLRDPDARIDVPALRFVNRDLQSGAMARRLESLSVDDLSGRDTPGQEAQVAYLRELLQDEARVTRLAEQMRRCDATEAIDRGMVRAFGGHLQTVENIPFEGWEHYLAWQLPYIREFMERLKN